MLSSAVPALIATLDGPGGQALVDLNNEAAEEVMVLDSISVTDSTAAGVDINLHNVSGLKTLVIESVLVSNSAAAGLDINISSTSLENLIIESVQVTGNTDVGVTIRLDDASVDNLTVFESTINGVRIVTTNSTIGNGTINGNSITGNSAGDGILIDLTNSQAPGFKINDNAAVDGNAGNGIAVELDNSPLTDLVIDNNTITGNTSGDGIEFDVTNSNVDGSITNNQINDNAGNGVSFTANATPAFVAANGGPLMLDFLSTDPVTGVANKIDGNTISGNTGGSGILVTLPDDTRFEADVTANTVSDNEGFGFRVDATAGTFNVNVGGDARHPVTGNFIQSNTFSNNRGAGISFLMRNTSGADVNNTPNHFEIRNNVITETRDDDDDNNSLIGDGIHVQLSTTNLLVNATAVLTNPIIDGNFVGTDRNGAPGLGNAGRGISVNLQDNTEISDLDITDNFVNNNGGTGVQLLRLDNSILSDQLDVNTNPNAGPLSRAVNIVGNMIDNNGQSPTGPIPRPESVSNSGDGLQIIARNGTVTLNDFLIGDNIISRNFRGIHLEAGADGRILADLTNNMVDSNQSDGILVTEEVNDPTDFRRTSGTWVKNTIINNGGHGIELAGATGGVNPLAIGLDGIDPLDGRNRGNIINSNALDGIEINGSGSSWIINNEIAHNGTGGVDLNALGVTNPTMTLMRNAIIDNQGDGLEIGNGNVTTVNVTALGNTIKMNAGRGVDILNRDNGTLNVKFGDGTVDGRNLIVENLLEGFYVVNTPAAAQDQDLPSDQLFSQPGIAAILDGRNVGSGGAPDMVLNLDNNHIKQNGKDSPIEGAGLVLRIGTSRAGTSPFSTANGLGNEDGSNGNGRVNARIVNNSFEGNFGVDVFIESFTATIDPPQTGGTWSDTQFEVNPGFRRDPLARLNLVFQGNDGNSIDVTNPGAYYDNDESTFKSRTNGRTAPDPNGPFSSGTRRRNAQRIAARSEDTNGNGTLDPGEDTNGNGVIDRLNPQTGADNGAFLFDGMGQSTFRIAAGFDGVDGIPNDGQHFTSGTGFLVDNGPVLGNTNAAGEIYAGGGPNQIPWGWGLWTPNDGVNSFIDPFQDVAPFQPVP